MHFLNLQLLSLAFASSVVLSGCGDSESVDLDKGSSLPLHADLDIELVVDGEKRSVDRAILTERLVHQGADWDNDLHSFGWAGQAYFVEFSYQGDAISRVEDYELFDSKGNYLAEWNASGHSQVFWGGSEKTKLKYIALSMERIPLLAIQACNEIRISTKAEKSE